MRLRFSGRKTLTVVCVLFVCMEQALEKEPPTDFIVLLGDTRRGVIGRNGFGI